MNSLPLFHRIAGQPVIVLGEGEAAEAKRRLVGRAGGIAISDEAAAAQLAFVALADPEAAVVRLKARGVLVNVVDRPELCDFTVPSLLERGPVVIAVGTGGVSAGLAKALRLRLEALLPQSLGALAEALGTARSALRQRWSDPGERRRALDTALAKGGPLDPLADHPEQAVSEWLEGAAVTGTWRFEFVLNSDDPDDLTFRQARSLGGADLILFEAGVPDAILNQARADAARAQIEIGSGTAKFEGNVVVIRRG